VAGDGLAGPAGRLLIERRGVLDELSAASGLQDEVAGRVGVHVGDAWYCMRICERSACRASMRSYSSWPWLLP